jgi:hypothetical protein
MKSLYNNNTPINLVINNIINIEDTTCHYIKNILNKYKELADILVVHYLSIRAIYDLPPLLNISYRDKRPTTHIVFDVEKVLLAGLLIQVDCSNAILNYINTNFPEKIEKIYDIIDQYINIDININILSGNPSENFKIYVENIYNYVSKILEILN